MLTLLRIRQIPSNALTHTYEKNNLFATTKTNCFILIRQNVLKFKEKLSNYFEITQKNQWPATKTIYLSQECAQSKANKVTNGGQF